MENKIALLLLVLSIGLLFRECLRDFRHGELISEVKSENDRVSNAPKLKQHKKRKHHSGLFILLRQKWSILHELAVLKSFTALV
ncbi:MAG: hypothetical protein KatS3mg055_0868 [Chloroflexus sp.]|uniref:hypothetical protein n=1 Tax=Chloroflexus sp. TaxID=1904827 RepID=UPI0021DECFD2|nr:hypothetical protein [Chloroflexus sp.]GIV88350.1 MAG: hypothetical protein KatS3mg055_0868 [Chloroflexus sp.]